MQKLTFIRLDGALITDSRRERTVRVADLRRLALEIAGAALRLRGGLVIGHGCGSFAHPAAEKARLVPGRLRRHRLAGVSTTQLEARRLHSRVLEALDEAGLCPYSMAPSAFLAAAKSRPVHVTVEPLFRSLHLGLVPVLYADIVMDREWGACAVTAEAVFLSVIDRLRKRRIGVRRVVWAGETDGIRDPAGELVRTITPRSAPRVLKRLEEAGGAESNAEIRHTLESGLMLARRGVTSWVVNGQRSGALSAALLERVPKGTKIAPARR